MLQDIHTHTHSAYGSRVQVNRWTHLSRPLRDTVIMANTREVVWQKNYNIFSFNDKLLTDGQETISQKYNTV